MLGSYKFSKLSIVEEKLLKEDFMSIDDLVDKYNYDDLSRLGLLPASDLIVSLDWIAITDAPYPTYIEDTRTKVKYLGKRTWAIKDYVYSEGSYLKKEE